MKHAGTGIACMWYPIGFTVAANPSAAIVKVNEDGSAEVLSGTVEGGQGATTVLGQIAAETLGIDASMVRLVWGETDSTPMDTGAVASRTTFVTGNAVRMAAEAALAIVFEAAAALIGCEPEELEAAEGEIRVVGRPERSISIGEAADWAQNGMGRPVIGSASFNPPTTPLEPGTGQGEPFAAYVYGTQIADVIVDDETGEVEVVRVCAAHDSGTAVNPPLIEGQIEGGVAMGIGMALQEEMLFDEDGRIVNPNLTNYIIPTSMDVPPIDIDIVESYDPIGPFGAKGVGEPTLVPTLAAITNAIYDAVGVRITNLPATSEKVLAALRSRDEEARSS